jgi:hypothetical protein
MYTCSACREPCGPGTSMLRHVERRPDNTIRAEHPVCGPCKRQLDKGSTLQELQRIFAGQVQVPDPEPVVAVAVTPTAVKLGGKVRHRKECPDCHNPLTSCRCAPGE